MYLKKNIRWVKNLRKNHFKISPNCTWKWIIETVSNVQVGKCSPRQRILHRRHIIVDWNLIWLLDRPRILLSFFRCGIVGWHNQCVNRHVDGNDVCVDVFVAVPGESFFLYCVIETINKSDRILCLYIVLKTPVPAPATTPVGPYKLSIHPTTGSWNVDVTAKTHKSC